MEVLNFGSLNIDHVYRVAHIARSGETVSSISFETFAGGKGANQSAAIAGAGAGVFHAGKIGVDGKWLLEKLKSLGVRTKFISVGEQPTGHAIIQVDDEGRNSIVLFPGCNKSIERGEIKSVLENFNEGDILLMQNEINEVPFIMETGHKRGMKICFNPAPFSENVLRYPLDLVDLLIVNEIEGKGFVGDDSPEGVVAGFAEMFPKAEVILTLGKDGVIYRSPDEEIRVEAVDTKAVDSTGAGDTFIGYYIASRAADKPVRRCLEIACSAAALCVSRKGAMDSIPALSELSGI